MAASSTTSQPVSEENVLSERASGGETSHNGPRRWERPWSLPEIHAEAGNWSLAGDAGLLQHLQEFSQRMISRTHQTGKDVDDLVHEAKLMNVKVNNVINDFIMLANTQFVENRVYDEDVTEDVSNKEERKVEQEKTKEQREAEIVPRVAFALKLGIDVIDNAFVKLDARVADSDSEDEDNIGPAEAILEAKDPYVTRPLPFLIGTPKFMEDDNIGLVEEFSDEEEKSDQGSISVSEDDDDDGDVESEASQPEYSTSEESEDVNINKQTEAKSRVQKVSSSASDAGDDDSDQDMFSVKRSRAGRPRGDSAHSGDVSASDEDEPLPKGRPVPATGIPKDLSSELASRLGAGAPQQARGVEEEDGWAEKSNETHKQRKGSQSSGKYPKEVQKGKKEKDRVEGKTEKLNSKHIKQNFEDDALFGQDEGRDEYDDLFGKDGGLFSSSKGLFDDKDEGDLFADAKKPPVKNQRPKKDEKPRKADDLLFADGGHNADGDDILPIPKPKTPSIHTVKKPTAQPAAAPGKGVAKGGGAAGGLFDESEDEDDLFGEATKKVDQAKKVENSTKKTTTPTAKTLDLFSDDAGDDNDDLFGSLAVSAVKSKPHGNVGLTVEGYDEGEKVEEKRLEDEQLRRKATPEKKLPPGAVSLFGKGSNPILESLKKQQPFPSSSDEDENQSLAPEDRSSRSSSIHSTSSALKAGAKDYPSLNSNNVAGTSEEVDPLFTSLPKPGSSQSSVEKDNKESKSFPKANHHPEKSDKSKSSKDSLFDSSGDESIDIFSSFVKPVESKRPGKQVSMIGDSNAGLAKTEKDSLPASKKKGSALFDDGDDDEPLFLSKPLQAAGGTNTAKNKTQGLFAHGDLLSGQDENPSVDLFSNKELIVEKDSPPPATIPTKKATPTARALTTSLFSGDDDGDDDGDLFSVKPVKPSPTVKATPVIQESGSSHSEDNKTHTKEPKKLAGAVSMFGGLDPSALPDKSKPHAPSPDKESGRKDENTGKEDKARALSAESGKTVNVVTAKPLPATSLFEDVDEEDLFSPKRGPVPVARAAPMETPDTPPAKEMLAAADSKPEIEAKKPAVTDSKPQIKAKKPVAADSKPEIEAKKPAVTDSKPEIKAKKPAASDSKPEIEAKKPAVTDSKPEIKAKKPAAADSKPDIEAKKPVTSDSKPEIKAKKPVTADSKPEIEGKKPTAAVSMPGSVHQTGLFQKERDVEPREENESEGSQENKTLAPQISAKPQILKEKSENLVKSKSVAASGGLFGDDGSDDLFASTTKKTTPPHTAPKSHAPSVGIPSVSKESPKPERETTLPEAVRPRVLPGAVSMFRGINPFAAVKSSSVSSETDHERGASPQKEISASLTLYNDPLSVLTSPVTITTTNTKLVTTDTLEKVHRQYVSQRPSFLDNSQDTFASLNFDQPGETETLSSASKDRPKLNRRRPMSRKARLQAAAHTDMDFEDSTKPSTLPSPDGATSLPEKHLHTPNEVQPNPETGLFRTKSQLDSPSAPKEKLHSPPKQRASNSDEIFTSDLFKGKDTELARESAEDLFSDLGAPDPRRAKPINEESKPKATESIQNKNSENDVLFKQGDVSKSGNQSDGDLFPEFGKLSQVGSKSAIEKISRTPKNEIANSKNNMFSSNAMVNSAADGLSSVSSHDDAMVNSTADNLSSVSSHDDLHTSLSTASTGDKTKLINDFDDDDLFKPASRASAPKSKLVIEKVIDDDLFSTFQPSSASGLFVTGQKSAEIFHDEDDLFGTSSLNKQKDTKTKPDSDAAERDDLMDAQKSLDIKSTRPKRAVAKESNLLKDTTDIFSDVPSPVPREPKKKTPKKIAEKNVFQGDIDDIFADSTAVTIKPKRDAKKKLAKPAAVASDNIFDDPLS